MRPPARSPAHHAGPGPILYMSSLQACVIERDDVTELSPVLFFVQGIQAEHAHASNLFLLRESKNAHRLRNPGVSIVFACSTGTSMYGRESGTTLPLQDRPTSTTMEKKVADKFYF